MSIPFRPGDNLRCIAVDCPPYGTATELTNGRIYKCLATDREDDILYVVVKDDSGERGAYIPDRFERVLQ
jgi:hypothetical protein